MSKKATCNWRWSLAHERKTTIRVKAVDRRTRARNVQLTIARPTFWPKSWNEPGSIKMQSKRNKQLPYPWHHDSSFILYFYTTLEFMSHLCYREGLFLGTSYDNYIRDESTAQREKILRQFLHVFLYFKTLYSAYHLINLN